MVQPPLYPVGSPTPSLAIYQFKSDVPHLTPPVEDGAEEQEDDKFDFGEDLLFDEELERVMEKVEREYRQASEAPDFEPSGTPNGNGRIMDDIEDLDSAYADTHHTVAASQQTVTAGSPMPCRRKDNDANDNSESHEVEVENPTVFDTGESIAPFHQFRKKGSLSVSDLVGPLWCETQYDYRLRTFPYLPLEQRPEVITSTAGKKISVDRARTEGKERVMKRGTAIHKRLEREIHPEEIAVATATREEVWGLRFLNMLSAAEALLTIGKCREFPVVGFIKGVMVLGIIDELDLTPVPVPTKSNSKPSTPTNSKDSSRQTSLGTFFSPTKPRPVPQSDPQSRTRTHKLLVSDSKTRTTNSVPDKENSAAGQLQVMMYKEMLDAILLAPQVPSFPSKDQQGEEGDLLEILPSYSKDPFTWPKLFAYLSLSSTESFSDQFLQESRVVIESNMLRFEPQKAKCLDDLVEIWEKYIGLLGLGCRPSTGLDSTAPQEGGTKSKEEDWKSLGRADDRLELVYRRAGGKKKDKTVRRRRKRVRRGIRSNENVETHATLMGEVTDIEDLRDKEDQRLMEVAIAESLKFVDGPEEMTSVPASALESDLASIDDHTLEIAPTVLSSTLAEIASSASLDFSNPKHSRTAEEDSGTTDDFSTASDDEYFAQVAQSGLGDKETETGMRSPGRVGIAHVATPVAYKSQGRSTESTTESIAPSQTTDPASISEDLHNLSAGTIIGRHSFSHSPERLADHLVSVLQFWMGERPPKGVEIHEARRCGWCEFEEGCEWRLMKAEETSMSRKKIMSV